MKGNPEEKFGCGGLDFECKSRSKEGLNNKGNSEIIILTAADVPESFLDFCIKQAKDEQKKEEIERIREHTYGNR